MNEKKAAIVALLKQRYKRDVRKQLVKAMQDAESDKTVQNNAHQLIAQIFSFALQELGWDFVTNSQEWDDTPLQIMQEVFPKIEQTQWFEEQQLTTKGNIPIYNPAVT